MVKQSRRHYLIILEFIVLLKPCVDRVAEWVAWQTLERKVRGLNHAWGMSFAFSQRGIPHVKLVRRTTHVCWQLVFHVGVIERERLPGRDPEFKVPDSGSPNKEGHDVDNTNH